MRERSARKRRAITKAATRVFLAKGYSGTSMDEIAALAEVSKQTVYKHFADKDRLFAQIVLDATDQVDGLVRVVAGNLANTKNLEKDLTALARRLIVALMEPQMLRLRRLIIANADRFPELGRTWYERGFERVLDTLATSFRGLADRGWLRKGDQSVAANHFVGLLLWIPMNKAMFMGDKQATPEAQLERHAKAAVTAFLAAYRRR